MNKAYDKRLRDLVLDIAEDLDMRFVQEGVFAMIGGPCFETPSEARLIKVDNRIRQIISEMLNTDLW
jgi:purine nucleoside phosphorylase